MIEKVYFGEMENGQPVYRYVLTNGNGLAASFLDLGATWYSMTAPDREGRMADVLLGSASVDGCLRNGGHLGETVGRNANRIGGASFELNGKTVSLEANDGANNLHSGTSYYGKRIWKAEILEETGKQDGDPAGKADRIAFSLESPDGDQGFSGNASIRVTFALTGDNELQIHYEAVCDQDTVMNLTNHAYFNLAGHQSGPVLGQQVFIDADRITAADAASIPTGELRPVQGTPMDFTVMKPIGRDIDAAYDQLQFAGGYDHNWVLNHAPGQYALAAKARDEESGREMEVWTDLPGIQFYTGNYLDFKLPGKEGKLYTAREGYCFETQYFPDAVHHPQFPSPILKKGEKYDSRTSYRFAAR